MCGQYIVIYFQMKRFIVIISVCSLSHHCGLNYNTDNVEKYELCILVMLCENELSRMKIQFWNKQTPLLLRKEFFALKLSYMSKFPCPI